MGISDGWTDGRAGATLNAHNGRGGEIKKILKNTYKGLHVVDTPRLSHRCCQNSRLSYHRTYGMAPTCR